MENFKEYCGMNVHLLVDGTGYDSGHNSHASTTLEMRAKLTDETETYLLLEDICVVNKTPLNGKFKRGKINKEYIIGVFEKEEN